MGVVDSRQVPSMARSNEDEDSPDLKLKQVYNDFADHEGKLSKRKVLEAVQCLGYNPLQGQVEDWSSEFSGDFLNLDEFMQVLRCAGQETSAGQPEISEHFAVFDLDGEGWLPIAQLQHLLCTNFGSESETLEEEEFNFLISHLKKNDEGFIQYKDFARILSEKIYVERSNSY